jgi:hypothetical protein
LNYSLLNIKNGCDKKMKLSQAIIAIAGICFLLTTAGALADEEITRTTDEAPIDHNADEGERGLDEPLIAPPPNTEDEERDPLPESELVDMDDDISHILDASDSGVSDGDYDSDIAFGMTGDSSGSSEKESLELPIAIGVGVTGLLILGFLIIKRR